MCIIRSWQMLVVGEEENVALFAKYVQCSGRNEKLYNANDFWVNSSPQPMACNSKDILGKTLCGLGKGNIIFTRY